MKQITILFHRKFSSKIKAFSLLAFLILLFASCKTAPKSEDITDLEEIEEDTEIEPVEPIELSRTILGEGLQTAEELAAFFLTNNDEIDEDYIVEFAQLYIDEAAQENINSDVAFAQMCLETGFLRFGGLVQPEWHNYCGLGAMDAEHPGCVFETEQEGIRAHIQHLQAYGTTEDVELNNELIDPRYSWVHRTKFIENIEGLTGTWATDPSYAIKLENILCRMEQLLSEN